MIEEIVTLPWEEVGSESDCIWVVEFFHPECGGCRALAGPFKETAKKIRDDELGCRIASINCKLHPETCHRHGVLDYPTLRVWGTDRNLPQPNVVVPDLDSAFANPQEQPPKVLLYNNIREVCSNYNSEKTLQKCQAEIRTANHHLTIDTPAPLININGSDVVWVSDLRHALFVALTSERLTNENEAIASNSALVDLHKLATVAFPDRETRLQLHKRKFLTTEEKIKSQLSPASPEWIGCQGSKPVYRGLPCALWQLFHALTIGCHVNPNCRSTEYCPLKVIKNWVLHYYNCKVCRTHFAAGTVGWKPEYLSTSESVILLWKFHNEVNKRLSRDSTEDPFHLKVEFPSRSRCLYCYIGDHVDNLKLLQFLKKFYLSTSDVFEDLPVPLDSSSIVLDVGSLPQMPLLPLDTEQSINTSSQLMFLFVGLFLLVVGMYYSKQLIIRYKRFMMGLSKRKGIYTPDSNMSMV